MTWISQSWTHNGCCCLYNPKYGQVSQNLGTDKAENSLILLLTEQQFLTKYKVGRDPCLRVVGVAVWKTFHIGILNRKNKEN